MTIVEESKVHEILIVPSKKNPRPTKWTLIHPMMII